MCWRWNRSGSRRRLPAREQRMGGHHQSSQERNLLKRRDNIVQHRRFPRHKRRLRRDNPQRRRTLVFLANKQQRPIRELQRSPSAVHQPRHRSRQNATRVANRWMHDFVGRREQYVEIRQGPLFRGWCVGPRHQSQRRKLGHRRQVVSVRPFGCRPRHIVLGAGADMERHEVG